MTVRDKLEIGLDPDAGSRRDNVRRSGERAPWPGRSRKTAPFGASQGGASSIPQIRVAFSNQVIAQIELFTAPIFWRSSTMPG